MALQIDRYRVTRLLGQGAMGKVYLARDPRIDRDVAIKVLSTRREGSELRKRFRLEAKAIAALKHPNIVELYDYSGEDASELFLVMEYIPGHSLYHLIRDRGPMSEPTALCVAHELALALEHAHEHSVVHRDLKPENVLLHNGRVVLTDFGVVKAIAEKNVLGVRTPITTTQVLGTPGFMALEQLTGERVGVTTDIFCLGALLYNVTTAGLPFEGSDLAAMLEKLKKGHYLDPRHLNPLLTAAFCELVDQCLRPKPKDRPRSAAEVRRRVLGLLAEHGVTEVRAELANYEKDPARYAEEQRERSIEVLLRDLKVALKDRDEPRARAIIQRMKAIAPVDERMADISGVDLDPRQRPVFARGSPKPRRAAWFVAGLLFGSVLGAAAALVLARIGVIPAEWLSLVDSLVRAAQMP